MTPAAPKYGLIKHDNLMRTRTFSGGMDSLYEAIEVSKQADKLKAFEQVKERGLTFMPDGRLELISAEGVLYQSALTDLAFGQWCGILGTRLLGTSSALSRPDWTALHGMNPEAWAMAWNGLKLPNETREMHMYDGALTAALSRQYKRITNTQVLGIVAGILEVEQQRHRNPDLGISYVAVSPTKTEAHIVVKNPRHANTGGNNPATSMGAGDSDPTRNYGGGFTISNAEDGTGAVWIKPFIQRTSCRNSIMFETGYQLRHIGNNIVMANEVAVHITAAIDQTGDLLEKVIQADVIALPTLTSVVQAMSERAGWDKASTALIKDGFRENTAFAVVQGIEGRETIGGLINGLSYAANKTEDIEQAHALSTLAGKLAITPSDQFMQWVNTLRPELVTSAPQQTRRPRQQFWR